MRVIASHHQQQLVFRGDSVLEEPGALAAHQPPRSIAGLSPPSSFLVAANALATGIACAFLVSLLAWVACVFFACTCVLRGRARIASCSRSLLLDC